MSRYSFGNFMREARRAKGISLRTLADALGYSAPFISDVENGKRKPFASEDILRRLAKLLDLDENHLRSVAHLSRHGAFLLPHVSDLHDAVASELVANWEMLDIRQLTLIRRAMSKAS